MTVPFTNVKSTATISTAERSLPADTTSGVPTSQTTPANVRILIDASAMQAGDQFNVVVYEKINGGTQGKMITYPLVGAQGEFLDFGPFALIEGWDITLEKIAGTDSAIGWSLREDLGNRNVSSLSLIHISEPTRLLSISYAVFCLKKK